MAVISVFLQSAGFTMYQCDRELLLGVNLKSMAKIFNCIRTGDSVTIESGHGGDTIKFIVESVDDNVVRNRKQ